ncbi:hypothetical protein AV656_08455 [Bhargavaea cecembensis]|uniref:Uncharacterized protein n=1 Tax=Bhargavaea cecembensis TaxID=394098 RepID=A0A161RG24_9BACL|nr:hypothetical protein [Bhargavaea cecembensis]KZE38922.1 hypothetical protein AV656_08455 [Bhargavaea cecembensis]
MSVEEEKYMEKAYIEWLLSDLGNVQLAGLAVLVDSKKTMKQYEKLPVGFLKNQLLKAKSRKYLRDKKFLLPLSFLVDEPQRQWTAEELAEAADEHGVPVSAKAAALFSKNFHEEAYLLYEQRDEESGQPQPEPDAPDLHKTAQEPAGEKNNDKKVEKKLQKKIDNLKQENDALQAEVRKLKEEMKDRTAEWILTENRLKQEAAEEKKQRIQAEEALETEKAAREKAEKTAEAHSEEMNALKSELHARELSAAAPQESAATSEADEIRLAFIGDPRNRRLVSQPGLEVDVYTLETIDRYLEKASSYEKCYYLSYKIDEVEFEMNVPAEYRETIITVENFKQLKDKMGELTI